MFETLTAWLTTPLQRETVEPSVGESGPALVRESGRIVLRSLLVGALLVGTLVAIGWTTVYVAQLVEGSIALLTTWLLATAAASVAPIAVARVLFQ